MKVSPKRTELAALRIKSDVRQKELAAALGCSVSQLQKVELGSRKSASLLLRAKVILGK
jgi:transcriptional regulator with XRE-family HTH domain